MIFKIHERVRVNSHDILGYRTGVIASIFVDHDIPEPQYRLKGHNRTYLESELSKATAHDIHAEAHLDYSRGTPQRPYYYKHELFSDFSDEELYRIKEVLDSHKDILSKKIRNKIKYILRLKKWINEYEKTWDWNSK